MLTAKQVSEIREHLEKTQNPIFFYDNDADGLCSFILLRRFLERGKGVAIKSFPDLDVNYLRKVEEFKSDYIFILDKPVVSETFWKEAEKINIPIVWIDHHETQGNVKEIPDFIYYYNVAMNKTPSNEPVTALCYQLTKRKEDSWIAVIGCIADKFIPDFYEEFKENYPELAYLKKTDDAFDIFYKSSIGLIARMMNFALKDNVSNVVNMQKFLVGVKTPSEILEESSKNSTMHKRFNFIFKKYSSLLEKAKELSTSEKILFFQYGGELSMSCDLANELIYLFPKKIIVVVYIKGAKANVSMRGKNAKKIITQAIEGLEGARGGGHEESVGGNIRVDDLEIFRKRVMEIVG